MNLSQKYNKKQIMITVGVALVVLIGIGTGVWYANEQNKKQKILDSFDIVFKEDAMIEYGQEKIDFNDFIKEKKGEPKITLPTDKIDTKKLEKKQIEYVLSKDGYSKNKNLTIEVKDTKAPEIILKEEIVTLEYGVEYDIKDNIASVKDPVDGDVPYAETAGESNYYVVEGSVDTATSGNYTVTIKAVDKNKIESKKTYTIHVDEEQNKESSNNASGGSGYTPLSSNSGGSSSGGSGLTTVPPTTCTANGQWKSFGNSGYASYSFDEADSYGLANCPDGYLYNVITVRDICGQSGWSVHYEKLN